VRAVRQLKVIATLPKPVSTHNSCSDGSDVPPPQPTASKNDHSGARRPRGSTLQRWSMTPSPVAAGVAVAT
jgi:hypothetical protein